MGLFALRDIAEGEELTFDYQFERLGTKKQVYALRSPATLNRTECFGLQLPLRCQDVPWVPGREAGEGGDLETNRRSEWEEKGTSTASSARGSLLANFAPGRQESAETKGPCSKLGARLQRCAFFGGQC